MDFATLRKKLANRSYSTLEQFEVGTDVFFYSFILVDSMGFLLLLVTWLRRITLYLKLLLMNCEYLVRINLL